MADPVGLQAWLPSTPGNQFQLPSGDSPKTHSFFFFPPPLSKDTCLIMEDMYTNHRSLNWNKSWLPAQYKKLRSRHLGL